MEIKLVIPGDPIPKARPRFARRGKFVQTYNCQENQERIFRDICRLQTAYEPISKDISIYLKCRFYMPIPVSWTKKKHEQLKHFGISHVKKPDVDNMVKFVKDCLNGLVWHDDSQVTSLFAEKEYSYNPRTEIIISWSDNAL